MQKQSIILFLKYFCPTGNGYIFDLSDEVFKELSIEATGIDIKKKYDYKFSKFNSLKMFINDNSINNKSKYNILKVLLKYRKEQISNDRELWDEKWPNLKNKIDELEELFGPDTWNDNIIPHILDDEYWKKKIDTLIHGIQNGDSGVIIGKTKELFETCFKTLLDQNNISFKKNIGFKTLVDMAFDVFVSKNNLDANVLNFFKSMQEQISILGLIRNEYGDGHGKSIGAKTLPKDIALVISNISIVYLNFLISKGELQN